MHAVARRFVRARYARRTAGAPFGRGHAHRDSQSDEDLESISAQLTLPKGGQKRNRGTDRPSVNNISESALAMRVCVSSLW
jgi:hypothetical protein